MNADILILNYKVCEFTDFVNDFKFAVNFDMPSSESKSFMNLILLLSQKSQD